MSDMTITCGELDLRLADYLDGSLAAAERAVVERHLATCARCAGALAALDERPAAAALPMLTPSRDLWSGIASRIEPRVLPLTERPARALTERRRSVGTLAVAAAALIAITATMTVMITRRAPTPEARNPAPVQSGPAVDPTRQNVSAHERVIRTYDQEIAGLDSAVQLRQGQLDTATIRIIEKNLKVIDAAILESRRALEKDPHNHFLNDQLARVLDQKVGLLRTAALLPAGT